MKATVKQLATITFIALLLMAINVKAEGTEAKAKSSEAVETTLQLENWMTDETIWNTNSAMYVELAPESEATLQLEDWMTTTETWNLNYSIDEETEPALELENWMVSDLSWNINSVENEPALTVEQWMIDENVWK